MSGDRRFALLLLTPALLCVVGLVGWPMLQVVMLSFVEGRGFNLSGAGRTFDIRHFVGGEEKFPRMFPGELIAGRVARRHDFQSIRKPFMRRRDFHGPAGGQQNCRRCAHRTLVLEQHRVRAV